MPYESEEEDMFLNSVVEDIHIPNGEPSLCYEDTIISHSTAIQIDSDAVHDNFRNHPRKRNGEYLASNLRRISRPEIEPPTTEAIRPAETEPLKESSVVDVTNLVNSAEQRNSSDVLYREATHIPHNPSNRLTIEPSDEALYTFLKAPQLDQIRVNDSESDEELEDLPRFRIRLKPCGTQSKTSARAIRSRTISGNDIEVLRYSHEQSHGIDMLNELRDSIPKQKDTKHGNSRFYDAPKEPATWSPTAPVLVDSMHTTGSSRISWQGKSITPTWRGISQSSWQNVYENCEYFTRKCESWEPVVNLETDIQNKSEEDQQEEPIYSQIDKPASKKIQREECDTILTKYGIGDFMVRRNKETTILSVKVHTKIKHIKIEFNKECVKVGKETFNSMDELIVFYRERMPISMLHEPVFLAEEVLPRGLLR